MLNTAKTSVDNYYTLLSEKGVVDKCDDAKVMFMVLAEDFINRYYLDYIDGERLSRIRNAVASVTGTSCLVPYINPMDLRYIVNNQITVYDLDYQANVSLSELVWRIENIENTEIVIV